MFRGKGWFSGSMWKPKNLHSLDHLKYLYHVLSKNQTVHDQNKGLLVETLRSIAEILIWGDQNDSTVFDFFLEKNMLSFFLKFMKQKCGRYVCVQLLQTLNILFENIRNETSLYYLLSNNHVNSIIVHKFDFSDEEVMAYYISFLKTLSFKLNAHTIHFFYNEHTNDFPLYTEAIKFFNHNESMVRIAVRTLTLNVFKVDDKAMLKFIRDKTAAPYFSNLVWFIAKHVMELDACVTTHANAQVQTKLSDLVAEHLDHLHYLNDILCLRIDALNEVLTNHLLNQHLVPLYVYSLTQRKRASVSEEEKRVSTIVSLFLLSQVFLIISHQPLVRHLADIILNGGMSVFDNCPRNFATGSNGEASSEASPSASQKVPEKPAAAKANSQYPSEKQKFDDQVPIENTDDMRDQEVFLENCVDTLKSENLPQTVPEEDITEAADVLNNVPGCDNSHSFIAEGANITDEEKVVAAQKVLQFEDIQNRFSLSERPFLEAVFSALDCTDSDHAALFSLCLLYALGHNPGINQELLDKVLMPSDKSETKFYYNVNLIERMLKIISLSCQYNSKVRLATLQMTILLLKQLALKDCQSFLQDRHLAAIEQYREESTLMLRNFYKSEEIFLDMFEAEYEEMKKKPLNVEYLMMDANLLLPPMGTPMLGVEFHKRLPCGEVERARRAIRVFFLLRDLSLTLQNEPELQLPLTTSSIKVNDLLDLENGDLFCCTVVTRDGQKIKRFMVIDTYQLILVDSEPKRLGWGVAKFVGFLQDIEVTGDKDDSRCLHITVQKPSSVAAGNNRSPLLAAKFVFDDHIRCLAAKQRLTQGRHKARQQKLHQIARLLDLPDHVQPCPSPFKHGIHSLREADHPSSMHRSQSQDTGLRGRSGVSSGAGRQHFRHSAFAPSSKLPGYVTKLKHDETTLSPTNLEPVDKNSKGSDRHRTSSSPVSSRRQSPKSRESSPRQRASSSSEEIPLEDLSKSRSSRHSSPNIRRRSTSGLPQARISAPPGMCHIHHLPSTVQGKSSSATSYINDNTENKSETKHSLHQEDIPSTDHAQPPKTLQPADAPPISLVLETNENKADVATSAPIILPPTDDTILISSNIPESPSEKVCTKPCCAMEQSHEKLELDSACSSDVNFVTNCIEENESNSEANVHSTAAKENSQPAKGATEERWPSIVSASSNAKSKGAVQTV